MGALNEAMFMSTVMNHPNVVNESTHWEKRDRRKSRKVVYPL